MRKERFMIPKVRIRERFLGTKSVRKVTTRGNPRLLTRITVPRRRTNSRIPRCVAKSGMR